MQIQTLNTTPSPVFSRVNEDHSTQALFSFEKWKVFGTVALSFVCDKYYLIMD